MSLWSRISNAVRGERLNREIEEELQSHMDEAIASGRDPDEARRTFGSIMRQREASHSIRVAGWLESLFADTKFRLAAALAQQDRRPRRLCFRSPSALGRVSPLSVLSTPCSGARCLSPVPAGSTSSPAR